MSLKDLPIEDEYRSDRCNLLQDFYLPCIEESTLYRRAVGFFSSTSLAIAAKGLTALIRSGGKMQLIASPCLSPEDIEAIATGLKQKEQVISDITQQELDQEFSEVVNHRLACLAWLIRQGVLDIKLAVVKNIREQGIYHEKLGIFADRDNNIIVFTGSPNESSSALLENFECIDVYCSWHLGVRERVLKKVENFEKLWDNETEKVEVITFSEAAKRSLLKLSPVQKPIWEPGLPKKPKPYSVSEGKGGYNINSERQHQESLNIPDDIILRPHQKQAIKEWFSHAGQGILEMATGSGKTITALAGASKLYEHIGSPLFIIIVCPYLHLVEQWIETARRFGLDPLPCAVSRNQWEGELSVRIYNTLGKKRLLCSIITSNATFASDAFQHQIQRLSRRFLFIVDEVHNLGATGLRNALPPQATYRLGLSATPERWFDVEGTQALTDYFGSTLVHYTLKNALDDGVLCPYRYYPKLIELTDDEFDLYYELTVKIARMLGNNKDTIDDPSSGLAGLLIARSRLLATAQQKLDTLYNLLHPLHQSNHNLIYCGDGMVETETEESLEKQIDAVTRLLGRNLGMTVAKYTAETPLTLRKELQQQFAQGEIQCLIAIRCLDEGVDIPETRRAFILASSANPRQFIQRRGRLLRTSPGKRMAEIYDFVVQPPEELTRPDSPYFSLTRSLFGKELKRVIEFASLAVNGYEVMGQLLELRNRLNLLDFGIEKNYG